MPAGSDALSFAGEMSPFFHRHRHALRESGMPGNSELIYAVFAPEVFAAMSIHEIRRERARRRGCCKIRYGECQICRHAVASTRPRARAAPPAPCARAYFVRRQGVLFATSVSAPRAPGHAAYALLRLPRAHRRVAAAQHRGRRIEVWARWRDSHYVSLPRSVCAQSGVGVAFFSAARRYVAMRCSI